MKAWILCALLACLFCGAAIAADKPVDVHDLMSASQFHASGLDKLTPQELAALNAWLAANAHLAVPAAITSKPALAAAAPVVASAVNTAKPAVLAAAPVTVPAAGSGGVDSFGRETMSGELRKEPERIVSRILGKFTGWRGNTVFKLENGQVWQQSDGSIYDADLQDPPVVIKRLGLGYLLTLTGHGATVFVKRIQ